MGIPSPSARFLWITSRPRARGRRERASSWTCRRPGCRGIPDDEDPGRYPLFRRFAEIDLISGRISDETMILNFRRLLEEDQIPEQAGDRAPWLWRVNRSDSGRRISRV